MTDRELPEATKIERNEADIKAQFWKKRYETELSFLFDYSLEKVLKDKGGKEYIERIKESSKAKDDTIATLRRELEAKRGELVCLKSKFRDLEAQCGTYERNWKNAELKYDKLEAEKEAKERLYQQSSFISLNHSNGGANLSRSSSVQNYAVPPPPPPVDIHTVEEIVRIAESSRLPSHHVYSNSIKGLDDDHLSQSSIQPYELDSDQMERSRRTSGSNDGSLRLSKARVGGSYGRVFGSRSGGRAP